MSSKAAKVYYQTKIYEMITLPVLGLISVTDRCKMLTYYQTCSDIFIYSSVFFSISFFYNFYIAYLAKSFYRRLERGEIILVTHGRSIVELID